MGRLVAEDVLGNCVYHVDRAGAPRQGAVAPDGHPRRDEAAVSEAGRHGERQHPAHPRRRAQLNSRLELRDFLRETFVEPTFRNSEQLLLEA